MPCENEEDHNALWDAVASLPSFHKKLSFPKLGRWFSWNGCACDQMKEFHSTKMLFEHHLDAPVDPNEEDTFDCEHLDDAAKAKTPAAELAAMKAAGGGDQTGVQTHVVVAAVSHQDPLRSDATAMDVVRRPGGDGQNAN